MAKVDNVTYGKPKIGGAVSVAPVGTDLPQDAKAQLNGSFKNLGYISEDGLTNENSPEVEKIKAWGGETVLTTQTEKSDTFTYTLIEVLNIDVLKEVYGTSNVTGSLDAGITLKATSQEPKPHSIVIEMILRGGILKRIVIPNGVITEVGEIAYADDDAVGYEITVEALPDNEGVTHIEYIVKGDA